ncbi:MAG: hypothetical protein D6731_14110 [Planctomycetota bacterium]|nr:MAG: hypothetical protein D6731_14110 [Planctomycetota bacterium]
MSPTGADLDALAQEARGLLSELERALVQGHLERRGPEATLRRFAGRFRAWRRRLEASPSARERAQRQRLGEWFERHRAALVAEAERAHRDRTKEPDAFGLRAGPGVGSDGAAQDLPRLVRRAVDEALDLRRVPGDLRAVVSASLGDWVLRQPELQPAFAALWSALCAAAEYLRRGLFFLDACESLRAAVEDRSAIAAEDLAALEDRLAELGRERRGLESLAERWIRDGASRAAGRPSLDPRLLLGPLDSFLDGLERDAGIASSANRIQLTLRRGLTVENPPDAVRSGPSVCTALEARF